MLVMLLFLLQNVQCICQNDMIKVLMLVVFRGVRVETVQVSCFGKQ